MAWLFLAVLPLQCSGSCCSESGFGLLNSGTSDICGRIGMCGMECDYASWICNSASGDGGVHWPKGGMSWCGGWIRSVMCAF